MHGIVVRGLLNAVTNHQVLGELTQEVYPHTFAFVSRGINFVRFKSVT